MDISFVVAMSENRVIGANGALPWRLPKDLAHFKRLTLGKNILMGRKTFESIGKLLPQRNNFILTSDREFHVDRVRAFHTKEQVLNSGLDHLMVIGGEQIYRLFLPECQKIFLTLVHAEITGDAFFPKFHGFKEICRDFREKDEKHEYNYSFIEYVRWNIN